MASLTRSDPVSDEAGARLGVADRDRHTPEPRGDDPTAGQIPQRQGTRRGEEEPDPGRVAFQIEAQDVFEVGQTVVPAEAHLVAEEGEHQSIGQRLSHDGEIDAGDPRAEGKIAEDEGERARHQDGHERGEPEKVEALPEPGQLRPVQEDHEVRQNRVAVDAAIADLTHQIHAHRIAAETEEGGMAQAEDTQIAPDQIHRDGEQRIGQILAEQGHRVGGDMPGARLGHDQIQDRHHDRDDEQDGQHCLSAFVAFHDTVQTHTHLSETSKS